MSGSEYTFDGDLGELERLAEEVEWFCEEHGLSSDVEFDLNLALEELFVNAVRHGGCAGVKDAARVRLERTGDGVRVEFSDRGREFDPAAVPAPDLEASMAERKAGGLGLHLVRNMMQDFAYRRSGEWNHMVMRRPT